MVMPLMRKLEILADALLKILLTNFCIYDCTYCVSRRSSNVPLKLAMNRQEDAAAVRGGFSATPRFPQEHKGQDRG